MKLGYLLSDLPDASIEILIKQGSEEDDVVDGYTLVSLKGLFMEELQKESVYDTVNKKDGHIANEDDVHFALVEDSGVINIQVVDAKDLKYNHEGEDHDGAFAGGSASNKLPACKYISLSAKDAAPEDASVSSSTMGLIVRLMILKVTKYNLTDKILKLLQSDDRNYESLTFESVQEESVSYRINKFLKTENSHSITDLMAIQKLKTIQKILYEIFPAHCNVVLAFKEIRSILKAYGNLKLFLQHLVKQDIIDASGKEVKGDKPVQELDLSSITGNHALLNESIAYLHKDNRFQSLEKQRANVFQSRKVKRVKADPDLDAKCTDCNSVLSEIMDRRACEGRYDTCSDIFLSISPFYILV